MVDIAERNRDRTRIYVDGKSLQQIAKESGLSIDTIRGRWQRGRRSYEELTAKMAHDVNVEKHRKPGQKEALPMYAAGQRMMEVILQSGLTLAEIARRCGVGRGTIYAFVYDGIDISSGRLARLCACCGVSADYVLGLKKR